MNFNFINKGPSGPGAVFGSRYFGPLFVSVCDFYFAIKVATNTNEVMMTYVAAGMISRSVSAAEIRHPELRGGDRFLSESLDCNSSRNRT